MRKCFISFLFLFIFALSPRAVAAELPFRDGDRIVIWSESAGMALSAQSSGNYRLAVPVAQEDGILTGFGETEIWTVIQSGDGWKFTNSGQYLSMEDDSGYLLLDAVHDLWTVESADGQICTFLNQAQGQLICLNSRRGQWLTCDPDAAGRSGETELSVYLLPRQTPEEEADSGIYFGQLHSHSTLSDGEVAPAELYAAAKAAGLDFFAVTDHSHAFDHHKEATLFDGDCSEDWRSGRADAVAAASADFLPLFAFEITWNQGQGHMNTFFTEGFLSRETEKYQSWAAGMEAYLDALPEHSVSQFNHPGEEFGTFKDFSVYSPEADRRITLLEVSEDLTAYFQALASGWHVGPTLSGDPHTFRSGPRTAVLMDTLTEESLQDALENRRVYATTDEDLQIHFTLDGHEMGSILPRADYPGQITFRIRLNDPTDSQIGLVELMSGGTVLAQQTLEGATGEISFTVHANRDHYLLRITQPDGDWAVTAPIWLDDRDNLGIRSLRAEAEVLTPGVPQKFSVELFNHEEANLAISAVTLSVEGTEYLSGGYPMEYLETDTVQFTHTFPVDGVYTLTAALTGTLEGREVTQHFSREFVVMPKKLVEDVVLDAGHGCAASVENFFALCANQDVSVNFLEIPATVKDLEPVRLLIIPAPESDFSEDYLAKTAEFIRKGGSILLCGTGNSENPRSSERLNRLLEVLGASGRFLANDVRDAVNNAGSPELIRTAEFASSPWTASLSEGQVFVQNRGCAIDPGPGQWLVRSLPTGGSAVLLSAEETSFGGHIFLSGGCLLSDEALSRPQESGYALPYANQTILEAILGLTRIPQEIIPIDRLRSAEPGRVYLAEGRITAGTANPNTTFPDAVYVQDHTGGIEATGYSDHGLALGTRVQVLGELIGGENPKFRVLRLTELGQDAPLQPQTANIPGSLLALEGLAGDIMSDGRAVSRFTLDGVTVIVENAIRSGSRGVNELARIVRAGNTLRAVGLGHWENGKPVLRLRDCDEVWLLEGQTGTLPTEPDTDAPENTEPEGPDDPDNPGGNEPDFPGSGDPADPDEENPPTGDNIGLFVLLLLISGWLLLSLRRFVWR